MKSLEKKDNLRKLKYTICFVQSFGHVLMLLRNKNPFKGMLNGIGGKIEPDESPIIAAKRELFEESKIHINDMKLLGIVTWDDASKEGYDGMYVYWCNLPIIVHSESAKLCSEGTLHWIPIDQVLNVNRMIVENIPFFLNEMVTNERLCRCHFDYNGYKISKLHVLQLPTDIEY